MKKNIFMILLFWSNLSFSAGAEDFDVNFVGCYPSGTCFIGVSPPATLTPCSGKNQIRFDISLPGSEGQYSAALTAFASKKKITVKLTDDCKDAFPVPDYIYVKN